VIRENIRIFKILLFSNGYLGRREKMLIKSKIKYFTKSFVYVNNSNNSGMALVAALIFVSVLVAFGTGLLALTNSDSKLSTLHRESNTAFYIAEKGIEKALYNLNEDDYFPMTSWRPTDDAPYSDEGSPEEYFLVTISNIGKSEGEDDDEEVIKITSKGIVDKEKYSSSTRIIEVKAKKDQFVYPKYKYAILTDKLITGKQSPIIEGDIHSNDDIKIDGIASAKLDFDGLATSSGDINDIAEENTFLPKVTIPTVNYGSLETIAESEGIEEGIEHIHGDTDDFVIQNQTINWEGLHYIKGNLRLKNSSVLNITNGAVIVEGEVTLDNSATLNINKPENKEDPFYEKEYAALAIVATGQIVLQNSSTSVNGVVQSIQKNGTSEQPLNKITIKNSAAVVGSVIAAEVELKNDGIINYDEETLNKIMEFGDEFYKKVSWREI
jgi:hypothetical protein